jgi:hypothetical protein
MSCFSIAWIGQLLIWLIIIAAVIAVLRIVIPWVLSKIGADGGIIMQVINIVFWAVISIFVVYICIQLLSCLIGFGGGLSLSPQRHGDILGMMAYAQDAATPAITQNTVRTTGPVSSETTISVGTLAGQALEWVTAVAAVPVSGVLTACLIRAFKLIGVTITPALSAKADEMLLHMMSQAAAELKPALAGKGQIAVKNAILSRTIELASEHHLDDLKAIGIDPTRDATVAAVRIGGRLEAMINNPDIATPKVLDSDKPPNLEVT